MINFEHYVRARSLEEAYELNQEFQNVVGGGMMWLHLSNASYKTYIDLCDLGLGEIKEEEDTIQIGAMVTLSQLLNSSLLREYYGDVFEECIKHIVGVQFQNMATLGGSIMAKLAFSDIITLLLPLDPILEFHKQGEVKLSEFLKQKNQRDILKFIYLPKQKHSMAFVSLRKNYTDLPVLNLCGLKTEEGILYAVGARPNIAVLVKKDEEVTFGRNPRGSKEYREHLYPILKQRIQNALEVAE